MSSHPRTFSTTLALSLDHGDTHEVALVLSYRFAPGYPDTRNEPGEPDTAEILSARIVPPGGVEVDVPTWMPALIEADEALHAALIEDARATDASERSDAAERRWEEERLSA